jgi:hypothetical protein
MSSVQTLQHIIRQQIINRIISQNRNINLGNKIELEFSNGSINEITAFKNNNIYLSYNIGNKFIYFHYIKNNPNFINGFGTYEHINLNDLSNLTLIKLIRLILN